MNGTTCTASNVEQREVSATEVLHFFLAAPVRSMILEGEHQHAEAVETAHERRGATQRVRLDHPVRPRLNGREMVGVPLGQWVEEVQKRSMERVDQEGKF
jgi:hypothetical protein